MPLEPTTTRSLDHVLATAQREARLPSVTAGLVRGGELVWSGAAGTVDGRAGGRAADTDTQYRMGSITKTFVAVAVLRLRDAGRLELTDRLGAHVPGSALDDVTVEQLLTHASGAQAETNGPWWERTPGADWDALVASSVGQRFRAGRRFHYSNTGYAALGRLLEEHHGRGWFDVVRDELLEPLGMIADDGPPVGCRRARARRAPLRRRAPARAGARRRRHGTRGSAVDDGAGPRALGGLPRWRHGRPAVDRDPRRDGRAAPRRRRPRQAVGRGPRPGLAGVATSTASGSPGTAGRCRGSSPGCASSWMPSRP